MFYKINTNTETQNTEPLLLGEIWGQVSAHNIFINQSIHNLVLCVFLYKDTLLNIFCWFINTELTANSSVTQTWVKLTKHMFFFFFQKGTSQSSLT